MNQVFVHTGTVGMASMLAPHLREQDHIEGEAQMGIPLEVGLPSVVARSTEAYAFFVDRRIEAMAGVIRMTDEIGAPWFVSSPVPFSTASLRRRITTHAFRYLRKFATHYPFLVNTVQQSNQTAIAWLKVLGFDILPDTIMHGTTPFHPFILGADDVR